MPTVLRVLGFRFLFTASNGASHPMSTSRTGKAAKYWPDPVELASSDGFRAHELNRVRELVAEHYVEFRRRWDEHLNSQAGPG